MSIISEQRIVHFDRPVKLLAWPGIRRAQQRADVKRRRGHPSGAVSSDFVRLECEMWLAERRGQDVAARKARLVFLRLRERMLERKREVRYLAGLRRRPSIKHKINRSQRQREFIRLHDEQQAQ
ncbi:hypothetical protein KTD31_01240 [Burkholderia multivorans]|uniref:hypothetical protein n=1 Tax=Burkholderia multivorans TaxID=87883 RepID=UPI001C23663C|nr:hypothetical protein [Burkholderia multivorans]MBU9200026.1 hypothetical protein [Burkholderia multivorans]MDN8078855.1 hypothetical protein [Burkholderia multivorans]